MQIRERIARITAERTGQSAEKVEKDMDRDYFLSAEEAVQYGIVDKIIQRL
ncbi:ATP-dependent Clp protease proteolytic subunit [compost metagenome]